VSTKRHPPAGIQPKANTAIGRDGAPAAHTGQGHRDQDEGQGTSRSASEDGAMTAPNPTPRATVRAALERAGWRLDADEPHVIEASDGEHCGVAVFFEDGQPVAIAYGDGENFQHCEAWDEAPGILAPADVGRLFREEKGSR
jgi:hypothetical protein